MNLEVYLVVVQKAIRQTSYESASHTSLLSAILRITMAAQSPHNIDHQIIFAFLFHILFLIVLKFDSISSTLALCICT